MFERLKSGIFVPNQPKPVAVQCGYCPELIWKHKEANGRLFLLKGKPICARCRILKGSKMAKKILSDRKLYLRDKELAEKIEQEKANAQVAKIAAESQAQNPNVKLIK